MANVPPSPDAKTRNPRSRSTIVQSEREIWQLQPAELYADPKEPADVQFMDDLSAANRFKSFLVGAGAGVPSDVLRGLGALSSAFSDDVSKYESYLRMPAKAPESKKTKRARMSAWIAKLFRYGGNE
jgi:hypothetical protein